jgi:RNA polymerase sigma-70 factor, ECF subfamily
MPSLPSRSLHWLVACCLRLCRASTNEAASVAIQWGHSRETTEKVSHSSSFDVIRGGALNHQNSVISDRERDLLLLRAQTGDPEALNRLFESCRRPLYCRASRILQRPQDAEDAVQEAMLAAFTHLDRFEGRADFLTWATRIVINAALQRLRMIRTKATVCWEQVDAEFGGASFGEYLRDPQLGPEEQLQELERRQMLEDALHKLPPEVCRAVQLCKSTDLSLKEAASALGLPLSTLKARLHRGRRALMIRLKRKTQVRHNVRSSQLSAASDETLCTA